MTKLTKIGSGCLLLIILAMIFLSPNCSGPDLKVPQQNGTIKKISVPMYGYFSTSQKVEGVLYKIDIKNVAWVCITAPTVFIPIVILGWYFYTPVEIGNDIKVITPDGQILYIKDTTKFTVPIK